MVLSEEMSGFHGEGSIGNFVVYIDIPFIAFAFDIVLLIFQIRGCFGRLLTTCRTRPYAKLDC